MKISILIRVFTDYQWTDYNSTVCLSQKSYTSILKLKIQKVIRKDKKIDSFVHKS